MSNGNGQGGNGQRKVRNGLPPKKRSRAEHPVLIEEARKAYYAKHFLGLNWIKCYDYAKPGNKASKRVKTNLGKRLHDWYQENAPQDMLETLELHGLGKDRLAQEEEARLNAMTLKNVKVIIGEGEKARVVEKTIDVEDNSIRMRATELLADLQGARYKPAEGDKIANVIILNPVMSPKPIGSGE